MQERKAFRKYLLKQSILGLGIANGLLTVIVFYIKLHGQFETIEYSNLIQELLVTSVLIGLSVAMIGAFFTRKEIKSGSISLFTKEHCINKAIPNTKPFQAIMITVYTVVLGVVMTSMVLLIQKESMLNFSIFLFDSFIMCSILSGFAAVLTIEKTVHSYDVI